MKASLSQGQDHQVNGEQYGGRLPIFVIGHTLSIIFVSLTVNSPKVRSS